jgi:hypothetical protein
MEWNVKGPKKTVIGSESHGVVSSCVGSILVMPTVLPKVEAVTVTVAQRRAQILLVGTSLTNPLSTPLPVLPLELGGVV